MFLDFLYQRYGWDWHVYMAQPAEVMDELRELYRAEADIHAEKSGTKVPEYKNTAELVRVAAAEGMPINPEWLTLN
jgi:hypothetical protein